MTEAPKSDNIKTRIELHRMKDIIVQLMDIIKLLCKKRKLNTMTVLKHYTNITTDELDELNIRITSDTITKK
jgi:hypothetical protein